MAQYNVGDKVQKKSDNTIGVIKNSLNRGTSINYQIEFSNGTKAWIDESNLKPFENIMDPLEMFQNQNFSGIESFKRIISYQRLIGGLTNIFYSMNNSLTKYMPHQFLPVTKFLKSPEDRLLIADEVGLGKTIEAMYIWKELEARKNAKRLLIVCPAALREKWRKDMMNLFAITPKIVNAKELLEELEAIKINPRHENFAYICSMEAIRSKHTDGFKNINKLNHALEDFAENHEDEKAFDLTIIDEAHYLRNRETANFKTGVRLRDISDALILLSATPIQTASENLFSILNLLSPDTFDNKNTFEYLLNNDKPFINLANCLQKANATFEDFENALSQFNDGWYISDNELIVKIKENKEEIFKSQELRMNLAEQLRSFVFYDNYFNRTRRRFVFTDTAKRIPGTVHFSLSENEKYLYDRVTKLVKDMSKGQSEILTFALIARQRQMASCLPAAFKDWCEKYKNFSEDEFDEDGKTYAQTEEMEEKLSETLYGDFTDLSETKDTESEEKNNNIPDLNPFYNHIVHEFNDVRYEDLKKYDSKYMKFIESIKTRLASNPKEKIIVFSFFRGTNDYLSERLTEDGIANLAIKGGMGSLKDTYLEQFKNDDKINILISSEVGSEGLDLQFASIEYNYDLPWNPMHLEQRIGRIDRIGQEAEKLLIFNLICENTVEDRILQRLYERVDIFKNSIGDLEDIVGQPIQDLAKEIMNSSLSENEILEKADQKIQVLINQRQMNERLEEESALLDHYRDMVLSSIDEAKNNKRFIDNNELIFMIKDFFNNYYPGTFFGSFNNTSNYYTIKLSDDARYDFNVFRKNEHTDKSKHTNIGTNPIFIFAFNLKKDDKMMINSQLVDLDHPIFEWMKSVLISQPQKSYGCSAITAKASSTLPKGEYVYYIQKWINPGIDKLNELKYFICNAETKKILSESQSEKILNTILTYGDSLVNSNVRLSNFTKYGEAEEIIYNYAWDCCDEFKKNVGLKKKTLFEKQKKFIENNYSNKIKKVEDRIEELRNNSNPNIKNINKNKSRIGKLKNELKDKIRELEENMLQIPEVEDMATGVLIIED